MITIMQGDALALPVLLTLNGEPVKAEDVEAVRFSVGGIFKAFPGDVTFDDATGRFLLPLSQEDTFGLSQGSTRIIIRPKFKNNSIRGWKATAEMHVIACEDKEVM